MNRPLLLALSLFSLISAAGARAETRQIALPHETAVFRTSALPGGALAKQKCVICHSADYVSYQPPGMTQAQWTAEVAKMQHAYGAPLSDGEVKAIGAYLAVAYGSAKPDDASVLATSTTINLATQATTGTAPSTQPAIDAKALLDANGCLGCHSIDKKIVGPAYHDVASKYAHDAHAMASVADHIRQGGVGRWGQVPMPPFPGLTDAQAKALAEFVLRQ